MSAGALQDGPISKQPNALPQYGFGSDVSFVSLIDGNPFLFRVHTPKTQPSRPDDSDPFFIGTKYNDEISSATFQSAYPSAPPTSKPSEWTYADVARHMDWTTRASSPYISTSFSFAWAIWEAIRRYHRNVKHDVEIAVIDARAVSDRAVSALELLMKGSPKDRHKDHWKFHRFAVEAQDVLVWGCIPTNAVLASIPILQIVSRLPSYFLTSDSSNPKDVPLGRLAWDYTCKKPSYRQFCQAMSDRFLRNPIDRRLRDTTAGSVRLAICFLRPYIHKRVSEDFAGSTAQVCELAYVIACWPGQWWAREHPEIRDLVKCIVHVVWEEMRESKKIQTSTDASRMHEIVGGLEQLAQAYERRAHERKIHPLLTPMRSPSSSVPASPTARSETLSDSSTSTLSPMMSRSIQTEIYLSSPHKSAHKSEFSISEISSSSPSSSALPTPPATPPRSTPNASIILATPATSTTPEAKPENSPPIHEEDPTSPVTEETPDLAKSSERSVINEVLARTASCFMTGFFIGSFITLCIFSSHRRELAHHLT